MRYWTYIIMFLSIVCTELWASEAPLRDEAPSKEDLLEFQRTMQDQVAPTSYSRLIQPVVFHVIYKKDGTGYIPFMRLVEQINQLNRAFSATEAKQARYKKATDANIFFTLHAVKYIQDDNYNDLCNLPSVLKVERPKIMLNPAQYLNAYICYTEYQLGLSWLPYQSWFNQKTGEDHFALGITLHWALVGKNKWQPRGGKWFQGDIGTHEVGHHYGLMHPYEGDCYGDESNSDMIADTPRQTGNPFSNCKKKGKVDSCKNKPGKDDIQNYMGAYTDDCRSHFTPGQVKFMRDTIAVYKPTLMKQLPVGCVTAVDSTDNAPDLFPCSGEVFRTGKDGRPWCRTSATDSNLWGYACCPAADGSLNGENNCRAYDPNKVNVGVSF